MKARVSDLFSTQSGRNWHEQRRHGGKQRALISRRLDKRAFITFSMPPRIIKNLFLIFSLTYAWKIKTERHRRSKSINFTANPVLKAMGKRLGGVKSQRGHPGSHML